MWRLEEDTLLFRLGARWNPSLPVAAFDFDSTLHRHRGRGPAERDVLRVLAAFAGTWNLAIFTNRPANPRALTLGIAGTIAASKLIPLETFLAKMASAGLECDVFAATQNDVFRKPHVGAWDVFVRRRAVSPRAQAASFYCGDAAGRQGDFAASDRWFAHNAGLRFYVPEQLFGRLPVSAPLPPLRDGWGELEHEISEAVRRGDRVWDDAAKSVAGHVVVLVGSPASGKSTFAASLGGAAVVARDDHKSEARFARAAAEALRGGPATVVLDTTGGTADRRESLSRLAREARPDAPLTWVWVQTPKVICFHLDGVRVAAGKARTQLPKVAIHGFWKRFEPPTEEEAAGAGARLVSLPFAAGAGLFDKKYAAWAPLTWERAEARE